MKINKIIEDISIAAIVLTRVPINNIFSINQNIEIHRGQWAYPLIGSLLGFFLFLLIFLSDNIGIPHEASILISLSIGILLTGALHEDGVADFFDSLGGKDYSTRQKILKDSRLGIFWSVSINYCLHAKIFIIIGIRTPVSVGLWPYLLLEFGTVFNFTLG